jgi:hypothetical protein
MKKLIFTLVVTSLALILGCQENMTTDPNSILSKQSDQLLQDRIKICCKVYDPFTKDCRVIGYVDYIHQIIAIPENETGAYTILLKLEMNSELCDKCMMVHLEWLIKGTSEDTVYVSEEGIAIVDKSYSISNRNDIILCVQYLVTTEGVGIPRMCLREIENPEVDPIKVN